MRNKGSLKNQFSDRLVILNKSNGAWNHDQIKGHSMHMGNYIEPTL